MRKFSENHWGVFSHGAGCGISDFNGAEKGGDGTVKPPPDKKP